MTNQNPNHKFHKGDFAINRKNGKPCVVVFAFYGDRVMIAYQGVMVSQVPVSIQYDIADNLEMARQQDLVKQVVIKESNATE